MVLYSDKIRFCSVTNTVKTEKEGFAAPGETSISPTDPASILPWVPQWRAGRAGRAGVFTSLPFRSESSCPTSGTGTLARLHPSQRLRPPLILLFLLRRASSPGPSPPGWVGGPRRSGLLGTSFPLQLFLKEREAPLQLQLLLSLL